MKHYSLLIAFAVCSFFNFHCRAQGTAFTYQGRLNSVGNPATGAYDFRFTLYDSTNQPTGIVAGPVTMSAVSVNNGLFTVTLDFGANVFTGANRWLEIAVRPQGGAFATLTPRQAITPVPYAAFAMTPAGPQGPPGPLAPNVALRDTANEFTGAQTFLGFMRLDNLNGFSMSSSGNFSIDAPFSPGGRFVVHPNGRVGIGATFPEQMLSVGGGLNIDQNSANNGTVANTLSFGSGSGEAIGSQRVAGGNQNGLDFYTGFAKRLSIANDGRVDIYRPASIHDSLSIGNALAVSGPATIGGGATIDGALTLNGNLTTFGSSTFNGNQFVIGNHTVNGSSAISGNVSIAPPSSISFGNQTRQMLNLWSAGYGIGVQSQTLYFRSDNYFSWFRGGVHNDSAGNSGGGTELMWLTGSGNLNIAGAFGSLSDRNAKQDFEPVNERDILEKVAALPLVKWSYKTDASARHLGPMAQDFHAAFNLGGDDKHITTVDADGVALAAIQGLNQKLEEKIEEKNARIAELEARLSKLEQLITAAQGGSK